MDLNELVRKAQSGDQEAFGTVCIKFEGLIKKYAFQHHIRPIAGEAIAEGQLAVVQAIRLYNPSLGINFAGFVESRVKYAVWNLFKRERRIWQYETPLKQGKEEDGTDSIDTVSDNIDMEDMILGKTVMQELAEKIKMLPEKQQLVIVSTLIGELSLTRIAWEMGITPQAAHNLRKRGLDRLKILCAGMYRSEGGERHGSSQITAKLQARN